MKERIRVRVELAIGAPGSEITVQGQFVEFEVDRPDDQPRVAVRLPGDPPFVSANGSPWITVRSAGERSE